MEKQRRFQDGILESTKIKISELFPKMPNDDELHWILILKQLKISGLDIEHICSELIRRGFLQQDVDFNGDSVGDSKEILRRYRHIEDDLLFKILSRAPLIHDRLPLPLKRPTKSNYVGHFEKLTSTQVHTNSIYCLRYDQSGSRIITGSDDNLIKILAQGILQTTIRGHLNRNEGFVLDFDVSKDNQVMVTAGSDKTVRCWSLYGDQLSYHHIGKEIINTVISPCGKVLLVSCADGKVRAFGKAITGFEPEGLTLEAGTLNKDEVTSVLFHPSSKRFICGSEDGNIYLYSVKKLAFSRKNELPRNQRDLAAIRESTDGSTVLPSMIFESHRAPITELCFSPDGNRFASVCKGGVICLHAIGVDGFSKFQATINPPNNHIPLNEVQESKLEFSGVTFNSDGSQLVTFAANTIYIWDGYNLERLNTWTFHSSHITILQLNPVYQSQMLTAGTDGKVVVSENGNILFEYQLTEIILSGMFSPCGEQFCVADYKGFVHIFGPPDERYHQVPPQQFFELDFSKVKEDSYGVLWDETTLQLANPSKGEILSMQRVPWPVTKHMKGAALSIVDNNWSVQRDLEAFERSLEFDNMLWEPVDNR